MKLIGLVLAGMACVAAPVYAQEKANPPTYGTLTLSAGFEQDPRLIEVVSGGPVPAAELDDSCKGFIAGTPDVRVHYEAGNYPLLIGAISESDTTIVINDPQGRWACDDDSGGDGDPAFLFADPVSGQYDIWVGSFIESDTNPAIVYISESAELARD